jgi:cyclomaltodextrinase / maltogenic alpha-amylase / neopullulanase
MPDWIRHAIWWQVYPLGFTGAEPQAGLDTAITHRLDHLTSWLDYAVELGVSGIALGPIFASSTHGYDTVDHFRIDPRLGDDADFDALIAAVHRRGLRLVLDGVFNHVGREFPAFQEVLAKGPHAPLASWFRLSWPPGCAAGAEPNYATFEGHRELVALNHDERAVKDYVIKVMRFWLDRGADGWRLDAAYAVPPGFWATVLAPIRRGHPDAYFFGEVIHGDYSAFVRESGVDAVTQYELWKAVWSSLNDRNFFELASALDRHNRFLDDFVPLTFVGNHDVTRLASRLLEERHIPLALAILFTCGGAPSIYSGDEQAFRGIKENRAGGDDAIRPAFPAKPEALNPDGWRTYRLHQRLIGLRRQNSWLHQARTKILHLTNRQITYEARNGEHQLLVALNLNDATATQPVPNMRHVVAGCGDLGQVGTMDSWIRLPARGWAVLTAAAGDMVSPGDEPW